jgi:hypothetical protein
MAARGRHQLAFQRQPAAAGDAQAALSGNGRSSFSLMPEVSIDDVVDADLQRRRHGFVMEGDAEAGEGDALDGVAPGGRRWRASAGFVPASPRAPVPRACSAATRSIAPSASRRRVMRPFLSETAPTSACAARGRCAPAPR